MNNKEFHKDMRIQEFLEAGYIEFSSNEYLVMYQAALDELGEEYRAIKGFGLFGVRIVICKPDLFERFRNDLLNEIGKTREILQRRLDALSEIEMEVNQ